MEEVAFKLTSLLDSLPQCENKLMTIEEINLLLSTIPPNTLRTVVPNISFACVFECLSLDVSQEHLETCCNLLRKLLDAVDPTVLLANFHQELLIGLSYQNEAICTLCLQQVLRVASCEDSDVHLTKFVDVVQNTVRLIANQFLSVSKLAKKIVVHIGKTSRGLDLLLVRPEVLSCFDDVINEGDEARFRVYECLAELSAASIIGLQQADQSHLMRRFLGEFENDDILSHLNCLELLTTIAVTSHGYHYLQEKGVLLRLNNMIGDETNPLASLLVPGLIKLFGSICLIQPSTTLSNYRKFVKCVFDSINGPTSSGLSVVAIETIGFIGRSPEGKLALQREDDMKTTCSRLGVLMIDAPTEVRIRALEAICHLMELPVSAQIPVLLSLTEDWFSRLSHSVDDSISKVLSIAKQPFFELRIAAFRLLGALVLLPWCQSRLIERAGFLEYLLDRSTERGDRNGLEAKYNIVTKLAGSETAVLLNEQLIRLKEYIREGPFYVKYEAQVAFEQAD